MSILQFFIYNSAIFSLNIFEKIEIVRISTLQSKKISIKFLCTKTRHYFIKDGCRVLLLIGRAIWVIIFKEEVICFLIYEMGWWTRIHVWKQLFVSNFFYMISSFIILQDINVVLLLFIWRLFCVIIVKKKSCSVLEGLS